jgi:hypothetical protein
MLKGASKVLQAGGQARLVRASAACLLIVNLSCRNISPSGRPRILLLFLIASAAAGGKMMNAKNTRLSGRALRGKLFKRVKLHWRQFLRKVSLICRPTSKYCTNLITRYFSRDFPSSANNLTFPCNHGCQILSACRSCIQIYFSEKFFSCLWARIPSKPIINWCSMELVIRTQKIADIATVFV